VRFHDEVRIKSIKAKGKKLSVFSKNLLSQLSGEDDDDDDDEYTDEVHNLDAVSEEDLEEDGQETIARLKDDLFADDVENESGQKFPLYS